MNEETKALQAQIDLMSQALDMLLTSAEMEPKFRIRLFAAAKAMEADPDPAVAMAAAAWTERWNPKRPFMDDPMNQ